MLNVSDLGLNAQANAVAKLLDGGELRLLDEHGQALATLRFGMPAFQPANGGMIRARDIAPDLDAAGDGDAAFCECVNRAGDVVLAGDVGLPNSEAFIRLRSLTIPRGAEVYIEGLTYRAKREGE